MSYLDDITRVGMKITKQSSVNIDIICAELTTFDSRSSSSHSFPPDQLETALPVSQYHLQEWPMEGTLPTPARMLALVEHSRHHWMKSGFGLIAVHTSCR